MNNRQSVTQQVIDYMKQNIMDGIWIVGERIPSENELREELGVSRSSIRQAVSHYVGIGVLESVHGKGSFLLDDDVEGKSNDNKITTEDCRDIEQVLEFRRIVESEACYLATMKQTPELIRDLKKTLKVMRESENDITRFVNADIRFHKLICEASGNTLLAKSMNRILALHKKSQTLTRKTFGYNDGISYHEQILDAMEHGEAEVAKRRMHEHMQNAIRRLKEKGLV